MLILHYNYFNVWVYRTRVAHCTFEITLLQAIMLTLLLVCAFSPRVHSIPRGPLIFARNDVKRVARNKKPTKKHSLGCLNINSLPKRQNFDEITAFLTGSEKSTTVLFLETAFFKTSEKGIRISGAQVSLWEKRHKKGIFFKMPLTVVCPVFQNGNKVVVLRAKRFSTCRRPSGLAASPEPVRACRQR